MYSGARSMVMDVEVRRSEGLSIGFDVGFCTQIGSFVLCHIYAVFYFLRG